MVWVAVEVWVMAIREAGRALVGGLCVYVAMAACSAAQTASGPGGAGSGGSAGADAAQGGQGGAGGSSGAAEAGLDGFAEAFADALTDPVGEAMAGDAGAGTQVDVEQCSVTVGTAVFAEHAYPGKSVVDLSALRATRHSKVPVDGYTDQTFGQIDIRAGSARAICGTTAQSTYDSVTFYLPL